MNLINVIPKLRCRSKNITTHLAMSVRQSGSSNSQTVEEMKTVLKWSSRWVMRCREMMKGKGVMRSQRESKGVREWAESKWGLEGKMIRRFRLSCGWWRKQELLWLSPFCFCHLNSFKERPWAKGNFCQSMGNESRGTRWWRRRENLAET